MAKRRIRRKVLEHPHQKAALTSPLRLEILEHLLVTQKASVAEIAARMGRPADSLYYHIKKLVAAGLLVRAGERRSGKRTEATYELAAEHLEVAADPDDASHTMKALRSVMRLVERESESALVSGRFRDSGRERDLFIVRQRARLSRSALAEVNRHLNALAKIFAREFRNPPAPGEGRHCALLTALVPSPGKDRAPETRRGARK